MKDSSAHKKFIDTLEKKYGEWNKATSRFGNCSFGSISKELSMSASQFSKLIYGTATEGMYHRTIQNINRLIYNESIVKELEKVKEESKVQEKYIQKLNLAKKKILKHKLMIFLGSIIIGIVVSYLYFSIWGNKAYITKGPNEHPLSQFFDQEFNADFNSPYLDISEVNEYCPCSAFEGKWSLSKTYKLPLPVTRKPGVYYKGKSADVRMKCSRTESLNGKRGRVLQGYEYLVNEIWVDSKSTPLSPKYFDKNNLSFTAEFDALDFETNPDFKKVATIHSFFIDKFEIHNDSIVRIGEPYGRYATDIDKVLTGKYEIDVRDILANVLSNFTTTICNPTINAYCNPNELVESKSIIAFNCMYTIHTENLGIGGGYPYQKGYLLNEQQYGGNLNCDCED